MRAQGSPGNASALTESMCMNSPQSESLELYLLKYFCGFCAVPYEIKKLICTAIQKLLGAEVLQGWQNAAGRHKSLFHGTTGNHLCA